MEKDALFCCLSQGKYIYIKFDKNNIITKYIGFSSKQILSRQEIIDKLIDEDNKNTYNADCSVFEYMCQVHAQTMLKIF